MSKKNPQGLNGDLALNPPTRKRCKGLRGKCWPYVHCCVSLAKVTSTTRIQ